MLKSVLPGVVMVVAGSVTANPDVWVKTALTYHIVDDRVAGLSYRWHFDDYFSSRNIDIYDANKNGRFDDGEIVRLREETFDPLMQQAYHAHVWHGDSGYAELVASEFSAGYENTTLTYEFHLSLQPAADPAAGPVRASLLDRENVLDFRFFKRNFLLVDGDLPADCKFQLGRGKNARAGHPQVVTLKCGE